MKPFNYKSMGVINITPDSFSDGNQFNSLASFKTKFNQACSDFDILDIGAESTAPSNYAISLDEELSRFHEVFFPLLKMEKDPAISLSIDTYKVEVFSEVYDTVKKYWPKTNLIFNDVSGCIDDKLISLLRTDKEFSYVFSHNLVPSREITGEHMSYVNPGHITKDVIEYFVDNLKTLENFSHKIILDPCFGFSKTREQNWEIINSMSEIFNEFPNKYEVLFGISRKSFLRFPRELELKDLRNQKTLDATQALIIYNVLNELPYKKFIFRVHDLCSLNGIKNFQAINS